MNVTIPLPSKVLPAFEEDSRGEESLSEECSQHVCDGDQQLYKVESS